MTQAEGGGGGDAKTEGLRNKMGQKDHVGIVQCRKSQGEDSSNMPETARGRTWNLGRFQERKIHFANRSISSRLAARGIS